MRIVVTGGAGYVGSHTVRMLRRKGHDVVIYDNLSTGHRAAAQNCEFVIGDIADQIDLAPVLDGADAVIHFAANAYVGESVSNPRKYYRNNVEAALTLLNAVIDSHVRFLVFSSTCAVYGVPRRMPIKEDIALRPVNPYGVSKLFFEQALQSYDRAYGLRFAALRYFNAAGADESGEIGEMHQPETHLIPSALEVVLGKRDHLQIYGSDYGTADGTCVRDYVHVCDLADAHITALEYLKSGGHSVLANLGTGSGHSVTQVIREVEAVVGEKVRIKIYPRRAGDPPVLLADASYARSIFGWSPKRSLRQTIATAWNWASHNAGMPHGAKSI